MKKGKERKFCTVSFIAKISGFSRKLVMCNQDGSLGVVHSDSVMRKEKELPLSLCPRCYVMRCSNSVLNFFWTDKSTVLAPGPPISSVTTLIKCEYIHAKYLLFLYTFTCKSDNQLIICNERAGSFMISSQVIDIIMSWHGNFDHSLKIKRRKKSSFRQ